MYIGVDRYYYVDIVGSFGKNGFDGKVDGCWVGQQDLCQYKYNCIDNCDGCVLLV